MSNLIKELGSESYFRLIFSLEAFHRNDLYKLHIEEDVKLKNEYQRYLVGKVNNESERNISILRDFQRHFYLKLSENSKLYDSLFSSWKLPIKRLASGLSFEQSFSHNQLRSNKAS